MAPTWTLLFVDIVRVIQLLLICRDIGSNGQHVSASPSPLFPMHDSYEFGKDAAKHFALKAGLLDFNWGAYGHAPYEVMRQQNEKRLHIESCPSCWFYDDDGYERTDLLLEEVKLLASYLNVKDYADLVFTINASHAVNAVLKSLWTALKKSKCGRNHDKVCKMLQFSTVFPMNENLLRHLNEDPASPTQQIKTFQIRRKHLVNTRCLMKELKQFLQREENDDIFFATISHITYSPNSILDVSKITKLFRKHNIITLVDAAHAIGQIKIDISAIDPDIWLANGHKWLFSTRGTTVMYVRRELHELIYPLVISTVSNNRSELEPAATAMQQQFLFQGTMEDSIWFSMRPALQFRAKFGEDNILSYIHDLALDAMRIFEAKWGTSSYVDSEEHVGAMINPILPFQELNATLAEVLRLRLLNEHNVMINIRQYDNVWFARLMVAIYHERSDYEFLADVMLHEMTQMFTNSEPMQQSQYAEEYAVAQAHPNKYCNY